jgi:hypothetical protein
MQGVGGDWDRQTDSTWLLAVMALAFWPTGCYHDPLKRLSTRPAERPQTPARPGGLLLAPALEPVQAHNRAFSRDASSRTGSRPTRLYCTDRPTDTQHMVEFPTPPARLFDRQIFARIRSSLTAHPRRGGAPPWRGRGDGDREVLVTRDGAWKDGASRRDRRDPSLSMSELYSARMCRQGYFDSAKI